MAVNFDPSQLTPEQRQAWKMRQEHRHIKDKRLQKLMQHLVHQQKERFEMLSNALKALGKSK